MITTATIQIKSLSQLIYKTVKITDIDGGEFTGEAVTFASSVENESGFESIGIDQGDVIVEFEENEIAGIEILDEPR
ncbi:hypothetical protein FACS1894219_12930 [Clostridia bacterium]|nr:hypothetical protein FACS1894219_12930 [Clostridia bacterium]